MLWKLLKYDFRSMWKQFAIIWPAALVIALINRFTLPFEQNHSDFVLVDNGILSVITMSVFMGVLFAMFVVSMVFILKRFYQGLLGDEGYLMHTLPVHTWQLVASKLVCALFVTVVNSIIAVFAMFLLFPINWSELFRFDLWQEIIRGLSEHPDTILYLVEFCLLMLTALAVGLTMVYLSMAIGHLFARRRVLMSVVAFFAIDVVCNVIVSLVDDWGVWGIVSRLEDHAAFWVGILLMLVPAALFFAGTSYILKNRLNLE